MAALTAERERRMTNTDKLLRLFKANPGLWIDSRDLEPLGGRMAWRTRVADARKIVQGEGGVIENRFYRMKGGTIISEYRYLDHQPLGRSADVPVPDHWPAFDAPIQETFRLTAPERR